MHALVLGGTQFLGSHIVRALLEGGHTVSVLNRGQTRDELPVAVERLRGDRDKGMDGLAALAGRTWDICIDVSGYTPRQVRPSAERLRGKVHRYVFVSTVSVYGDPVERPAHENHSSGDPEASEDVTEVVGEMYGRLKVACENLIGEIYATRSTLLRPQIVTGPKDPSGRYTYWVQRARQGGEMLAPGDGSDHLQVIDVRDLARFVRTVVEEDLAGAFNLAGPRITWAEFMKLLEAKAITWVPASVIAAAGVTEFELPLFRPEHGPRSGLMDVSNERARAAGLKLTAPRNTLMDVKAWLGDSNFTPSFLPEREAELLRLIEENRLSAVERGG